MAKVRPSEIVDLTSALEKFGQNSASLEKKILKTIDAGKNLSNSVVKELSKIEKRVLKQQISIKKEIDKLTKSYDNLSDKERERLQNLKEQYEEGQVALQTLEKLTASTDSLTAKTKALGKGLAIAAIGFKALSSVMDLISGTFSLVTKAYDNWFRLEQNWMSSMASLRMEHGLTMQQAQEAQMGIEALRREYGNLTSEVDGIAITSQYFGEISNAIRMAGSDATDFATTLAAVRRVTGLTGESMNQVFRLVATGAPDANRAMEDWMVGTEDLANQLSVPVGAIRQDFVNASSDVARFGSQGMLAFRNAATMASRFGMEATKIFQMVKKFDTFQSGSDAVNQLNAMLGTTLSSFELMMETDPTSRLERIRQSVFDTGQSWDEMNHYQRDAIAQMLDIPVEEARRLFMENASFEDLERERQEREQAQRRDEALRMNNTERLNRMLASTQEIMEDWSRTATRIWNVVSEAIAPIFREVFGITSETREELLSWVEQLAHTTEFQDGVRSVAVSIRDIWADIKTSIEESNFTFEDFKEVAGTVWDIMKGIGQAVKTAWDTMSEMVNFFDGFVRMITFAGEAYKAIRDGNFEELGRIGANALFDDDGNFSNELVRRVVPEELVENISRISPEQAMAMRQTPEMRQVQQMQGLSQMNPFIAEAFSQAQNASALSSAPSLDRTRNAQPTAAAAAPPIVNVNINASADPSRMMEHVVDISTGR